MDDSPCDPEELCHGIVGNIPVEFHSADLRSFFSHFVESRGFDCFHFRHRPEVRISTDRNTEDVTKGKTCCCVVRLSRERMADFVKTYHGQNWEDRNKKCFAKKAMISRIKVKNHKIDKPGEPQYQTRKDRKQNVSGKVEFSRTDLQELPELHSPPMMPNGNVGTPTSVFLELIRSCKLPPRIVSKLGLNFPKNSSRKKYGNMPFDYDSLNRRRIRAADGGDIEEKSDGGDVSKEACVADLNEEGRIMKEMSAREEPCCSGGSSKRRETPTRSVQNEPVSRTSNKTQSSSSNCINPEIVSGGDEPYCSEGRSNMRETTTRSVQSEAFSRTSTKTQSNSSNCINPEIVSAGDEPYCSEGRSNMRETTTRSVQSEAVSRTSTKTQSNSSNDINPEVVSATEDPSSSEGSMERRELTTSRAVQDEHILRTVNKHSTSESSLSWTSTKTQSNSSNRVDPEIEKTQTVSIGGLNYPKARTPFRKRECSKLRSKNPEHSESAEGQAETESDGEVEDWERHEALHNDVDNQGRTRERLFEEEIELKWEKGGSGLVFYTDAAYWRQQEEADMDEEMADDWDIDMGVYEEPGGGDQDSRDLLQMRIEEQWRRGNEVDPNRIGGFEKFTKGFGGRMMRLQGWKEGKGLGSSQVGIAEPVSAEGQTPYSKRGLGYFGEKLERNVRVKRPRADRDIKISTIYDEPDGRGINMFQSQGPYILTYRDNVEFVPAKKVTMKHRTVQ